MSDNHNSLSSEITDATKQNNSSPAEVSEADYDIEIETEILSHDRKKQIRQLDADLRPTFEKFFGNALERVFSGNPKIERVGWSLLSKNLDDYRAIEDYAFDEDPQRASIQQKGALEERVGVRRYLHNTADNTLIMMEITIEAYEPGVYKGKLFSVPDKKHWKTENEDFERLRNKWIDCKLPLSVSPESKQGKKLLALQKEQERLLIEHFKNKATGMRVKLFELMVASPEESLPVVYLPGSKQKLFSKELPIDIEIKLPVSSTSVCRKALSADPIVRNYAPNGQPTTPEYKNRELKICTKALQKAIESAQSQIDRTEQVVDLLEESFC